MLFFALLRALVVVFLVMSVVSIPAMISNWKGDGLKVYRGQTPEQSSTPSLSDDLMMLSLANQPIHEYTTVGMEEGNDIGDVRLSQSIITLTDLANSIIFIVFVLCFQNYSSKTVEKINNTRPLPSYFTLIISKL